MTVTPTDVRQWLFRYLQGHMSWFDSPDWEVPGDKTIPRLVKAFEQLADYVATLRDDDPRFVSLADALTDADWTVDKLDGYLHGYLTSAYVVSDEPGEAPDRFIDRYLHSAAQTVRVNARRRS
jgi:hypothetical protein